MEWRRWGSNLRPLGLKSLYHWATVLPLSVLCPWACCLRESIRNFRAFPRLIERNIWVKLNENSVQEIWSRHVSVMDGLTKAISIYILPHLLCFGGVISGQKSKKKIGWSRMLPFGKIIWVDLFVCFTSQVNSYGHCGTVSSPNHTFSWAGLNKRLTSNSCTYFRL